MTALPDLTSIGSQLDSLTAVTEVGSTNMDNANDIPYLPGEQIYYKGQPTQSQWTLVPMFQETQTGAQQMWQVGWDPSKNQLVTTWGQIGGEFQTSSEIIESGKAGRTLLEQALLRANSKYKVKHDKGYRAIGETASLDIQLQKAATYLPPWHTKYATTTNKKTGESVAKRKPETKLYFPVAVQAKIDGTRGWARLLDNGSVHMGKLTDQKGYVYLDKIKENLKVFLEYLPPGIRLDGEVFTDKLIFDEISGAARRVKEKSKDDDKLNFFIFDIIIAETPTEKRYEILVDGYRKFLRDGNMNTHFHIISMDIADSHEQIRDFHNQYVSMGYEGLMIRKLGSVYTEPARQRSKDKSREQTYYRGKRNNSLLKYKEFYDEEGTVIGIKDETRIINGVEKHLALVTIRDDNGFEFDVQPMGTHETREEWLKNPSLIMGKRYTFTYFERYVSGLPRHPKGKAIRDYD